MSSQQEKLGQMRLNWVKLGKLSQKVGKKQAKLGQMSQMRSNKVK